MSIFFLIICCLFVQARVIEIASALYLLDDGVHWGGAPAVKGVCDAAWGQGHVAVSRSHVGGIEQAYTVPNVQPMSFVQGYGHALQGVKRSYTALGDVSMNSRGNPCAHSENTTVPGSSSQARFRENGSDY